MASQTYVLPGDYIDPELYPNNSTIKIGPGLRSVQSHILPVVSGQLCIDDRKGTMWVEHNGGRYNPTIGDLVIATIHHSAVDVYYAAITDYTAYASLPQLSFEGATKKTRPQLTQGCLVYARVSLANKHMDPELECVSASTGKSEGLGPLNGGMLFNISLGMARRLMMAKPAEQGSCIVLDELGAQGVAFEIAVGRNGKVWVNSKSVKATLAIGKAIQETDRKRLGLEEQKKFVRKLVREL